MLIRGVLVAIAFGLYAAPLLAHPVLTFVVVSHKEPPEGMKSSTGSAMRPSDETFPLTVTLGHQYLAVEARGTRTIYDFSRLRILRLNLATKRYTDDSLYTDIGFRAVEFQNRIVLGSALQTAKVATNPMPPALLEQLFSLTNAQGQTTIDQTQADGESTFLWQQQKLASISERTRELPAGYQSEYWRFLRYYAGGHPKIYAALASVQGVPEKITFVLTNMQTETRQITLNAIHTEPDAAYSLDGFAPLSPNQAPYGTLKLLGPDAAAQLSKRAAAVVRDRDTALAQGQVFNAVLANMALLFITGDSTGTTDWLEQNRDRVQSDQSAQALVASLGPKDSNSAPAAVQALAMLRKQPVAYGYVLGIFQGNTLLGVRDDKAGAEHLLAALAVNPYLLGAWKDLGGSYYQAFQAEKAWACWDAARRVNPQHPMLLQITQLEDQLRTGFPEFF